MKKLVLLIVIASALVAGGCASLPKQPVQQILSDIFPPEFHGDAHVYHKNPYFDVTVDAKNLRMENGVWKYDSLALHGSDRFTQTDIGAAQPATLTK